MFAGALVCVYLTVGLPMAIRERLFIWLVLGLAIYFGNGRAGATRARARREAARRRAAS